MVSFLRSGAAGDLSSASFLDVGTGNGHLLFRLREEEDEEGERAFRGRMVGADYSVKAVEFARRIAVERGGEEGEVEFVVWDVLGGKEAVMSGQGEGWDVVLDKGTFDAISLSEERDARGRRVVEGYKEGVVGVMREGGLLLVTSCNWTEVELRAWFEDADAGEGQGEVGLRYEKSIEYRSFSFGGKKGQTISSCCFRKVRL
jgi:SAM-dependent methyltransferase